MERALTRKRRVLTIYSALLYRFVEYLCLVYFLDLVRRRKASDVPRGVEDERSQVKLSTYKRIQREGANSNQSCLDL